MSSLTPSSEVHLFENSQLQNTVEETGFLKPLDSVKGIEHIGWHNDVEPIFRLTEGTSLSSVGTAIVEKVENGDFDSAGLRAFILPEGFTLDMCTTVFSNARIYIHIENWWESCIPSHISENKEVLSYIEEREQEISNRNREQSSLATVVLDGHADIPINGQSDFSESYGQYQFVGWK